MNPYAASTVPSGADAGLAHRVVAELRRTHGLHVCLGARFAGGLQNGAWRLHDAKGRDAAVLKCRVTAPDGPSVADIAAAVATVRDAGYPTPRWVAWGVTDDGTAYHVQDFVPGVASTPLTGGKLGPLLATLERQAGLDPLPAHDRSEHALRDATEDGPGSLRHAVRAIGRPGATLLARYDELLAAVGSVRMPRGDMVHGDFNSCNILLNDAGVGGVIDVDGIGSGTRVLDYAALLREAYVEGYGPEVIRRVRRAAEAVAGHGVLVRCAVPAAFFIAVFKARHEPERLGGVVERLHRLADDLTSGPV